MKRNIYLFEISDIFDDQVLIPYSTGLIWSYCLTNSLIAANYELDGWYCYRKTVEEILLEMDNPDVVGFSSSTWNYQYNLNMAKHIKEKYPKCLIVFGGMQQPHAKNSVGFFAEYPFVNIVVDYEGELTFEQILLENLKDNSTWEILGCAVNTDDGVVMAGPRLRIENINNMPSPYLDGLFDDLVVRDNKYKLQGIIETTRGCPYSCTFCEIGAKELQKIKSQSISKVQAEIQWCVDHKVEYLVNADSNFGLIGWHSDLIDWIIDVHKKTGYPHKFGIDWAKGKADRYVGMAKALSDGGLLKGISIALQSTNDEVLKAVRRVNIPRKKLEETLKLYDENDLGSYTELILGLPMETIESWNSGIVDLMEYGQHSSTMMHVLSALPNTPFHDKDYAEKYSIVTRRLKSTFYHMKLEKENEYPQEYEDIVIGNKTATTEQWKEMFMFKWLIGTGHYLGPTQYISRLLRQIYDIPYKDFYFKLFDSIKLESRTLLGREYDITLEHLDNVLYDGWNWGRIDKNISDYTWEYDEYTAMEITANKIGFYDDMKKFIMKTFKVNEEILDAIIDFQYLGMVDPRMKYPIVRDFEYNMYEVLEGKKLVKSPVLLKFIGKPDMPRDFYDDDYELFGKEIYWWGRKGGRYKLDYEVVDE